MPAGAAGDSEARGVRPVRRESLPGDVAAGDTVASHPLSIEHDRGRAATPGNSVAVTLMDPTTVASSLTRWTARRFPSPDHATCEDVASSTMQLLVSKFGHLEDQVEWLRLGYTIAERRAKDLLKSSARKRTEPLPEAAMDEASDPSLIVAQQDLVRRVLRAGFEAASTTEEVWLWDEWTNRVMQGDRISLRELSRSIWPEKHHSHASRTLTRILYAIDRGLADEVE